MNSISTHQVRLDDLPPDQRQACMGLSRVTSINDMTVIHQALSSLSSAIGPQCIQNLKQCKTKTLLRMCGGNFDKFGGMEPHMLVESLLQGQVDTLAMERVIRNREKKRITRGANSRNITVLK